MAYRIRTVSAWSRPIGIGLSLALALSLLVSLWSPIPAKARVEPTLSLSPDAGPCGTEVTIHGTNFGPNEPGQLLMSRVAPTFRSGGPFANYRAGADGTFTQRARLINCGGDPAGSPFQIAAYSPPIPNRPSDGTVRASVPFTLTGGPAAAFVLESDRGPCSAVVTARGAGLPPGAPVRFVSIHLGTAIRVEMPQADTTVSADGTFSRPLPFIGVGCNQSASVQEGTHILITAQIGALRPDGGGDFAVQAIYTVTATPQRCFAETGHCMRGRIRTYWESHGLDLGDPYLSDRESLALFGYPISDEFVQTLEDGKPYTVQYFERARFEYHPENPLPDDLLLGQFGRRIHGIDPPVAPVQGTRYFPETGHNLGGRFASFWEANGGLPVFGYPLTEVFKEELEDGTVRGVQYFERARFEYHTTAPDPYTVQLGHFGRRILAAQPSAQAGGDCAAADRTGTIHRSPRGAVAGAMAAGCATRPG